MSTISVGPSPSAVKDRQAHARRLRAEGKTVREIARSLGVSRSAAHNWSRGVRPGTAVPDDGLIGVPDACARYNLGEALLKSLARYGRVKAERRGRRLLVDAASVRAWLDDVGKIAA